MNGAVRFHRLDQRPAGLAGPEIMVAQLDRDRARLEPGLAQVVRHAPHQAEQLGVERRVRVKVLGEGLLPTHRLRLAPSHDLAAPLAAQAPVEPLTRTRACPAHQRCLIDPHRLGDGAEMVATQSFQQLWPDPGNRREVEGREECRLLPRRHDVDARRRPAGMRLGALHGKLGHQAIGAAAERNREPGPRQHIHPDPRGGRREGFVTIQRLGAAHGQVELVDAGGLHDRCPILQHRADLATLLPARRPGDGHEERIGAEPFGGADRHAGADAEGAGLVGGRADDATAAPPAADHQQRRLPCPLRIHQARHGAEHRIAVGQEDPGWGGH